MAYSQFHDGFWTDPEIRQLSADEKLILIWFITNPSRHYSGIYFFEFDSISKQTGLTEKTVLKGIDTLSKQRFIKYSSKFSMVWVVKMARHEVRKNEKTEQYSEKQTKGIANHFQTLHKCPLIKDFLEYYDTLQIPYVWGIRQEEVKEEEEEKSKEEVSPPTPPRGDAIPYQKIIDCWNLYAPKNLPRASLLEKRKSKIKDAWNKHPDLLWWQSLFADIILSPWHSHQDKWQGNSFDWMLNKADEMRERLSAKKGNGRGHMANLSPAMQGLVEWNLDQEEKEEIIDVESSDI